MAGEKFAEKVMKIAQTPKHIRNICTSAHIHHGKCVAPMTRLILASGEIVTAENLFFRAEKSGQKVRDDGVEVVFDISDQDVYVFSLNKETGTLEKKNVSHAWKLQGGDCIKITLRNGDRKSVV